MLDIYENKIKNLVDEDYYLEYLGNLFEYVGEQYNWYLFQDINDVSHILKLTYDELLKDEYEIVERGGIDYDKV